MTSLAPGPVAFARFAYPPRELGYCGPPDANQLFGVAAAGTDRQALAALAVRFDGAWPYLQLIARSNGIDDPLHPRVVDAYWIGNELLEHVPALGLAAHLDARREQIAVGDLAPAKKAALGGGTAHHSFHVFAVYPWLALLRAGVDGAPLEVLDKCRIRSATVVSLDGDTVNVCDRALTFDGHLLAEGPERVENVRRSLDGVSFTPDLAPGDVVALHWDWVCQRLTLDALERLQLWTARMLQVVNATGAGFVRDADPGPSS